METKGVIALGKKLILVDEINCQFQGLTMKELAHVRNQTSLPVAGAFMQLSYKQGIWDGKEALVDEEGITFQYMIDKVLDALEEYGSDLSSLEIIDERDQSIVPDGLEVGSDWLLEESGYNLRHYQKAAINLIIGSQNKGVVNAATSSGKSLTCLGISKALDPYTKSVVVVPDENLAKQTFKDYDKSDLNVLLMTPKIKPKDREKAIKDHRHIILTSKLFMNCIEYFKKEHFALLLDEVHKLCGDVMLGILRFDVPHWQIRIGLTGTVPKDKLKKTKIFCHLGGGIILKVSPRELQDEGHASTVSIKMIKCVHRELEDLFQEMYEMKDGNGNRGYDWSVEQDYLWSNKDRAVAIAEYINSLDKTNTLILCHPQFGQMLAPLVSEQGCINDEVHPDTRLEWLSGFDTKKDHYLVASFGTASTGLSYNHIYRVILIDVGKNFSYILQSIGRAMRLDGVHNHADVVDISSNMLYSNRHQKEREKIYKDEKFDYAIDNNYIMVG